MQIIGYGVRMRTCWKMEADEGDDEEMKKRG